MTVEEARQSIIQQAVVMCENCDIDREEFCDEREALEIAEEILYGSCPFCGKNLVFIAVCDDEGNFHGVPGCEYEKNPWSGIGYTLHHEGWGDCIMCTDGANSCMGGAIFDTYEDAIAAWNRRDND